MKLNQDQPLTFAGQHFIPMPSGALFWVAQNALLLADLHLEKMSSFAKGGQFFPPYDSYATLKNVYKDMQSTAAKRVICLGDSFHRDEGTGTLPPEARALLEHLTAIADWTWIAGNHDQLPHELGGECVPELLLENICLTHEPSRENAFTIAGHLHPAARIFIGGRTTRKPCFAADEKLLMMPAYGVSTGNLNILSAPFSALFDQDKLRVIMLGRDATYPVHPRRLVNG